MATASRRGTLLALGAASLLGVGLLWWTTSDGVGVSADSVTYIGVARSLASGGGPSIPFLHVPLTIFPPLYPAALAPGALLGIDLTAWARGLNLGCFAATVALSGALAWRATGGSAVASVAVAGVAALAPAMLEVHSWAWSEPLFIALCLAALLLTGRYVAEGRRRSLMGAAVLATLTALTRYAGLALVATVAVAPMLGETRPLARRLRDASIALVVGGSLPAAWLVRNALVTGRAAAKPLGLHPPPVADLASAADVLTMWFLPARFPVAVRAILLAVVILGILVAVRSSPDRSRPRVPHPAHRSPGAVAAVLAVWVCLYLAFLLANLTFVDAATPMDARILSPLLVPVLVLLASAVRSGVAVLRRRPSTAGTASGTVVAVAAVMFLALSLARGVGYGLARSHPRGLLQQSWTTSPLIDAVAALPRGTPLWSNDVHAVYFLAGRTVRPLPVPFDPHLDRPNADYRDRVGRLVREVSRRNGAVILFQVGEPLRPSASDLVAAGLRVRTRVADGQILGPP